LGKWAANQQLCVNERVLALDTSCLHIYANLTSCLRHVVVVATLMGVRVDWCDDDLISAGLLSTVKLSTDMSNVITHNNSLSETSRDMSTRDMSRSSKHY